jgi:hypothetical protein
MGVAGLVGCDNHPPCCCCLAFKWLPPDVALLPLPLPLLLPPEPLLPGQAAVPLL